MMPKGQRNPNPKPTVEITFAYRLPDRRRAMAKVRVEIPDGPLTADTCDIVGLEVGGSIGRLLKRSLPPAPPRVLPTITPTLPV
jgi:hypothetical protein